MQMSNTMRIVMLGKTGAGRSSLANTIFGEERFKISHTLNSETRQCKSETRSVNGRSITLVDTPGLFDTHRSEEELKPEIVRCITECAPGPHAFLIVLKVDIFTDQEQVGMKKIQKYFSDDVFKSATVVFTHGDQLPEGETIEDFVCKDKILMERFTEHEQAVITKIRQHFSKDALKYAVIVFTHGDQLPDRKKIEDFVSQNKNLRDLVEKCGGRCHVVDNRYWKHNEEDDYRSNKFQVEELLNTLDKMTEANQGLCYTNEMLQAVKRAVEREEELRTFITIFKWIEYFFFKHLMGHCVVLEEKSNCIISMT
uniref:AIG1-type G domain-containing protein n=1 Tax=Sparus aurata TaxID=8175 RepID=A0A671UN56_SPAAU